MNRITTVVLVIVLTGCGTISHPIHQPSDQVSKPPITQLAGSAQASDAPGTTSADAPIATDPDQAKLLSIQDRLNLFASPRFIAHVQAAKAAGSDALQNQCMDSMVDVGADFKAKPLIALPSLSLGPVDRSCGWCALTAKRKADAERSSGPSLIAQIADARRRLAASAHKVLVACAALREDERLKLLNPENAAAALFEFAKLVEGGQ